MEDNAACMLVVIGATPEGRKELVGFQVGVRESTRVRPVKAVFMVATRSVTLLLQRNTKA